MQEIKSHSCQRRGYDTVFIGEQDREARLAMRFVFYKLALGKFQPAEEVWWKSNLMASALAFVCNVLRVSANVYFTGQLDIRH